MKHDIVKIELVERPSDPRFIDRTGMVFGRLTVVALAPARGYRRMWYCRCSCSPNIFIVDGGAMAHGDTQSCGCLQKERTSKARTTHGHYGNDSPTPEMRSYSAAKDRCNNPRSKSYRHYGGRGIEFRFANIHEFLAAVGPRPSAQHSLDRRDVDGHYEAGNVRWATQKEQQNNRSNNRLITLDGETMPVAAWAGLLGVKAALVYARLDHGWCPECSVNRVPRKGCPHQV